MELELHLNRTRAAGQGNIAHRAAINEGERRHALNRAGGADRCRKLLKEIVGHLLGGAVDEALAEVLRELAADLGFDLVAEARCPPSSAVSFTHDRTALGETGHAAVALAGNPVSVRRIEV